MIRAYLKARLADHLARAAKWLAPDPKKLRIREPIDVVIPKEARAGARSDIADRLFRNMKDVSR
jgi:hypothetical protein